MSSAEETCDGSEVQIPEAPSPSDRPPALPAAEQSASTANRLTAEMLEESHPYLRDHWSKTMGQIRRAGGPWPCESCGGPSYLCYRCSKCGNDLCDN